VAGQTSEETGKRWLGGLPTPSVRSWHLLLDATRSSAPKGPRWETLLQGPLASAGLGLPAQSLNSGGADHPARFGQRSRQRLPRCRFDGFRSRPLLPPCGANRRARMQPWRLPSLSLKRLDATKADPNSVAYRNFRHYIGSNRQKSIRQ